MGVECTVYNVCFLFYVWLVPVFLQYLMCAPSSYDAAPFYPVPLSTLAGEEVHRLSVSHFPKNTGTGTYHCRPCKGDRHASAKYQWDVAVKISYSDLPNHDIKNPISTLYPVIFVSSDFRAWRVVADANDVGGNQHDPEDSKEDAGTTHMSAPLLVANLKEFGCSSAEKGDTDPFASQFPSHSQANFYRWKLMNHVSEHGTVNLVACVIQGMSEVLQLIHEYKHGCIAHGEGEMKCHYTPKQALGRCFALGSACGMACNIFSSHSPQCDDGELIPEIFEGLTPRRVRVKTSIAGGGAAESLTSCSKGLCIQNMYLEAVNPLEFLQTQHDAKDSEKGSFYAVMFAMSSSSVFKKGNKHHNGKPGHGEGSSHNEGSLAHHKHLEDVHSILKHEHGRVCVELPGVRLAGAHTNSLASLEGTSEASTSLKCTAECGARKACAQAVFAGPRVGCYLFKVGAITVTEFSDKFNSSYCGPMQQEHIMVAMLRQAYAQRAQIRRRLTSANAEHHYYWQIAHVPNGTIGIFKDMGTDTVQVTPKNGSCFAAPGFIYMVACMTAKPVYFIGGHNGKLHPPPFNDRCLALGGICGACCGSGSKTSHDAADNCPEFTSHHLRARRLRDSIYKEGTIETRKLVDRIEPRRSATQRSQASRVFFHLFIFFIAMSFTATFLSKLPGNFTDFYPMHTWDEICTHGYLLEKFGCAVSCGCSAGENKTTILRNWVGKIAARPHFQDHVFPSFSKWVDMFCDEGHREGARILWAAWTDFLDTDPSAEFLEQWSIALRDMTWDQATVRSPFDLRWSDEGGTRRILPVVFEQSACFQGMGEEREGEEDALEGGVLLEQDSHAKLVALFEVFRHLPGDLCMESALPTAEDVVLTRSVRMCLRVDGVSSTSFCFQVAFTRNWRNELSRKTTDRAKNLCFGSTEAYEKKLAVTDRSGRPVALFSRGFDCVSESMFPLHFREPPSRQDRQVIMIYCARAKPEKQHGGVAKTRDLDKYLWACLRPEAVNLTAMGGSSRKKRQQQQNNNNDNTNSINNSNNSNNNNSNNQSPEKVPLLNAEGPALLNAEGPALTLNTAVRRCVEDVLKQRQEKLANLDRNDLPAPMHDSCTSAYLKHRVVESSWELTRFCYGEIVGEDYDEDGDEVVILDNPSPALLGLVSRLYNMGPGFARSRGLGLVALGDEEEHTTRCGQTTKKARHSYASKMVDDHPTVMVKRKLVAPYIGVRGKSGGLNYCVDLLRFRKGFVGTGSARDPIPKHMLFGIFDARHQPHPDFWYQCLPKFMKNSDLGYTYEVNESVCMVQAPQSFASVSKDDDILDVLNGMTFNVMNIIRNRCGGVTSCGTNAVWNIDGAELSGAGRRNKCAPVQEYFDSRTKIEDTASTHLQFSKGKRSVYVHETVSTGIAKLNADYLCAMQRWAEGAVQLFWLQFFEDKNILLLCMGCGVALFWAILYTWLYGPWMKDIVGYNFFCDAEGAATLFTGTEHASCRQLYNMFGNFLYHEIDKVTWRQAEPQYMRLIDFGIMWFVVCLASTLLAMYLSWRGTMPKIVRTLIMMENVSYWLTSCSIFFWVSLTLYMIMAMEPPLMFNVTHFMIFVLCMNIANHGMINEYKTVGGCDEASIWRSQQSYTLAAPLYLMSIIRGTISAWGIIWHRLDKSFWTSSDHGTDVVISVTVWVSLIFLSFIACVGFSIASWLRGMLSGDTGTNIEKQTQVGALCMLGFLAMTVWEPFLTLWGFNKSIDVASRNLEKDWKFVSKVANLLVWWRSKAWIIRYIIDFGMPCLVLTGFLGGGASLISLAVYASTVHGFRS